MRLQRIYSSKLYVTSTRKDRIHAAMQDPINAELVQQLSDYLDDEAKIELKKAKAEIKEEQADKKAEDTSGGESSSSSEDSSRPTIPSGNSAFSGSPLDDFGADEFSDMGDDAGGDEGDSSDIPDAPADEVVESVTQEGKPITATSLIWTTIEDIVSDCDTIKGTLNAREDTNGVTRLEVKQADSNELWIYYSDDSNLNDKMIEVISVLNSTGYTYLKFNRLARSNNAIVFDINLNFAGQIKSNKEVEEEKK